MKKSINSFWLFFTFCLLLQVTSRAQSEAAQGEVFFNYGSVSGGISQYYYSSFTIGQPVVGPYFGSDYQGAFGLWSRFLVSPAPPVVDASEGDFPDRVLLTWKVDPLSPASDLGFKIYRDGAFLASVDPATLEFIDFNVIPGNFYNYQVRGVNTFGDGYLGAAVGFVNPNGSVTGQITTINNNPVAGVQVTLSPTLGKSLLFNGVNESVKIPYNNGYTDSLLTVSCWVKNSVNSDGDVVVDLGRANSKNWWINATAQGFEVGIGESGETKVFDITLSTAPMDWHHIAFTYNSSDLNVYLDGALLGTLSATMSVGNEWLYLGGNPAVANSYYGGQLDDLRIYQRQLSQTEIIRTMNATVPSNAPGLVAYWKFDEGTGYKIFDLSENQLDGYMTGVAFSNDRPAVLNAGVTDESGYYLIDGINYGGGQSFVARPSKDFEFNNALEFNASNGQFATMSGFQPTDSTNTGAIEIWFKPSVLSGPQSILSNGSIFDLSLNGTDLLLNFNGTTQNIGTITTTEYVHVAVNYSPSAIPNITTFVNGEVSVSFSESVPTNWDANPWTIGRSASANNYFTGLVDEVVFFKNTRNQSEIQSDAIAIDVVDLDLQVYFSLNETLGTTFGDQSPNNTGTGTITGASWTSITANPETVPHAFNPSSRIVTLNPSNVSADNVNFTDISTVSVSGFVRYEGTSCSAEGVEILVNGQTSLPPIYTNSEGRFVADFEPGTSFTLSPKNGNHNFIPAFWQISNIVVPKAGIVFSDQTKRTVEGKVEGGLCGKNIIPEGKTLEVHLTSIDPGKCYRDSFFFDGPGKKYKFTNVPPIEFELTVKSPEITHVDEFFDLLGGAQIDLTEADTTVNFVYRSNLAVATTALDTNSCGVPMLEQFKRYRVNVTAFEDYEGGRCLVDSVNLIVQNAMDNNFNIDSTYKANTFKYYFYAGQPRIEGDFTQSISFSVRDAVDSARISSTSLSAVVIGKRERTTEFTTVSPELPLMILRDPPGDGSYSTWESGKQLCNSMSMSMETGYELGIERKVSLGPVFHKGLGLATTTEVVADVFHSTDFEMGYTDEREMEVCMTATEHLETQSDDLIVGGEMGGDLYVGAAMNLIFGLTDELTFNDTTCTFELGEDLFIRPDGFATRYIYSEFHIKNVLIPDLLNTIQDTASAEMWQQVLDKNQATKDQAVFSENISLDGGVIYEYTKATETSNTETYSFVQKIAAGVATNLGIYEGGIGGEVDLSFNMSWTYGGSEVSTETNTNEVGYHLEDNDVSDNFSINVLQDKVFGTPVFDIVAGQSSCPHEPGTQNRDQVSIVTDEAILTNVPETEPAVFTVTVGNTSPSEDRRNYLLAVVGSSNPHGAIIKVNGQPTTDPILFDLNYLETADATITVEKGPIEYDYEDILISFYADCETQRALDIGIDTDPLFEQKIAISAHFIESCSDVDIASPSADWVVTPANNNLLPVVLNGYDTDDTDLNLLRVQYRAIGGNGAWINITEIGADTLDELTETILWNVSSLADGPFEIRAVSECLGFLPAGISSTIQGKLERDPPALLGLPQPSDGILSGADQIYIDFSEFVDCSSLSALPANFGGYVNLIDTETNDPIDIIITCSENSIYITPNIQNKFIENKILRAEVDGIKDLAGNPITEPITWEFFVDRNPLKWVGGDIEEVKYEDDGWLVTRTIQNTGGQTEVFTLQNIPFWITPSVATGEIAPGGSKLVVFTVSNDIASGRYQDTLVLRNSMGDEPLGLDLAVLCHPPLWDINPADFEYNMSLTVELNIEGESSKDEFDLVAAFIDGNLSGLGQVEYVASLDKYLVFLTVFHNNIMSGEVEFQIWDASDCLLYGSVVETYSFVNGGSSGTPINPDILHTQNIVLREIPVTNGWNWISFNLDMPDGDPNVVLESLDHPENATIKGKFNFSQYSISLGSWSGSLQDLEYTTMYKYKGTTKDTITLLGHPINSDTVDIPIYVGWNWIGYIPQQGASLNEALSSLTPLNGDIIKGQSTFAQYVVGTGWIGSLNYMEAPNGYLLKSGTTGVLNQIMSGGDPEVFKKAKNKSMAQSRSSVWEVNPSEFEHSMNMVAMVMADTFSLLKAEDEVAAFVDGKVRGVATPIYIETENVYVLFLTIYANEAGEDLQFQYYDSATGDIHPLNETFEFDINEIAGSIDDPMPLTYATVSSSRDLANSFNLSIQPNPFTESTNIKFTLPIADMVTITVFDVGGNLVRKQKLDLTDGPHSIELNASAGMGGMMLDKGMYIVTLKGSTGQVSEKVLLVK